MVTDSTSKRAGTTLVTSVSVSREFAKIIDQHNLSPTECFRRGIAVTLCDLGVGMYQSPKNEERSKFMHEFMQKLEADEKLKEEYSKMKLFDEIKKHLNNIKRIAGEIENGN